MFSIFIIPRLPRCRLGDILLVMKKRMLEINNKKAYFMALPN